MRNIRNPQPKALLRAMGECHLLDVNNLCGFGAGGGKTIKESRYVTTALSTASSTSHSWNNVDIGVPDPSRIVVVCSSSYTGDISTMTIDGVAMTPPVVNANASSYGGIYAKAWPSGTTANFAATCTSTNNNQELSVYVIYGATSATPYVTASDTTNPGTLNSNVLANSFGIAHCMGENGGTNSLTIVGVTQDWVIQSWGANNKKAASASQFFTADESPRTISMTYGAVGWPTFVFAAWK